MKLSWKHAHGQRGWFIVIYSSFVLGLLITSSLPWLYGWFINSIQQEGFQALRFAWIYALAYIGLNLLKWAFFGLARIKEQSMAFTIGNNLLKDAYHRSLYMHMSWHKDQHSGSLINRIRKAHEALKNFFQSGFVYFHAIARFVISSAAMIYFSPLFGGIGIVLGIVAIFITIKFDKPLIRHLNATNEKEHLVSSTLFDSLSNITTVKTLRLEERMKKSLSDRIHAVYPPFIRSAVLGEWKWFATDMLVALIYGMVTVGYVIQHWQPGTTFLVGGIVTLLAYVTQFTGVFYEFAWQYNQVVKYNVDVDGIDLLYREGGKEQVALGNDALPGQWQVIDIEKINFAYGQGNGSERGDFRLSDFSIRLEKGKKIAVIGESGSGKTTVLNLLRGLYTPPAEPEVVIDRKVHVKLEAVQHQVVLFPQEPEIFENTIRYNLTMGVSYTEQEIAAACEAANLNEVIAQLPDGLDATINEKGVNLSGGQKQRLALARGILAAKNAPLILLDEPTSSIDAKNELQIYQQLFTLFANKVIISSLHRLYLLPLFDHIYLIKNGRLEAEGSFEFLRENNTWFREACVRSVDLLPPLQPASKAVKAEHL